MSDAFKLRAIALGTFDGLHPGHRAVIGECVRFAMEKRVSALIYTFWENPKTLFGAEPLRIMPVSEKIERILKLGANEVAVDHFTKDLSGKSPEDFINMLIERFHPVAFVCGEDYTFGAKGAGSSSKLKHIASQSGIETIIVPTVTVSAKAGGTGEKVSSSLIRAALERGDTHMAECLIKGESF